MPEHKLRLVWDRARDYCHHHHCGRFNWHGTVLIVCLLGGLWAMAWLLQWVTSE